MEAKHGGKSGKYQYKIHEPPIIIRVQLLHSKLSRVLELVLTLWRTPKPQGFSDVSLDVVYAERVRALKFDRSRLVDFRERLSPALPGGVRVERIEPFITVPGIAVLTNDRFYFQPSNINNIGEKCVSYKLSDVRRVYRRRYMQQQRGIEFRFLSNSSSAHPSLADPESMCQSVLFACANRKERMHFCRHCGCCGA